MPGVYTLLWGQFVEQREGETKFQDWGQICFEGEQAERRIWVKGLPDRDIMPVRLSKAFIFACIHGGDLVDVVILMT